MSGFLSILPFSICLIHSLMYAQFDSLVSGLRYTCFNTTCPTCIHAHVRIQVGSYKHAKLIIIYYYCMSVCVCCSTGLICSKLDCFAWPSWYSNWWSRDNIAKDVHHLWSPIFLLDKYDPIRGSRIVLPVVGLVVFFVRLLSLLLFLLACHCAYSLLGSSYDTGQASPSQQVSFQWQLGHNHLLAIGL